MRTLNNIIINFDQRLYYNSYCTNLIILLSCVIVTLCHDLLKVHGLNTWTVTGWLAVLRL